MSKLLIGCLLESAGLSHWDHGMLDEKSFSGGRRVQDDRGSPTRIMPHAVCSIFILLPSTLKVARPSRKKATPASLKKQMQMHQ